MIAVAAVATTLAAALILARGCGGTVYSMQVFTYPPDGNLDTGDWQYLLEYRAESREPLTSHADKVVTIVIKDSAERTLLRDRLTLLCARVRAEATWHDAHSVDVRLYEVGSKAADDEYNRAPVQDGPRDLRTLRYRYNAADGVFERVE